VSLINKMLQDLETRQETPAASTPVYKDLRPVSAGTRRGAGRLLAVLVFVVGLGVAVYFAADRMGVALLPASVMAMISPKPAVAPDPASVKTVVNTATVATGPTQTSKPAEEAAIAREESKAEVTSQVTQTTQPIVASQEVVTAAEESKPLVAPAPVTKSPAVQSQKKSQVRIVKAAEPSTTDASKTASAAAPTAAPAKKQKVSASTPLPAQQVAVVDKKIRPLSAEEKSEAAYRYAVRLLDQGRPEEAAVQLRETMRAQPEHVAARELAAGLALQAGHWREAQSLLEEGLRQVPSHYPFARLLARVYVDHGAEAKALAVMESAVPAGSDDPEFSALLGVLYQRAGRHADAVQVYKRALALRPQDARSWLGFAISLEGTEQWDAAKRAYARAKEAGGLTPPLNQYAEQRLAALTQKTQH